jgi:PleD family two-component response regulator
LILAGVLIPWIVKAGVASLDINKTTIDLLIQHADQALYHAKANGCNQVQYSHPNTP